MESSKGLKGTAAALAVAGLLLGGVAGYAAGMNKEGAQQSSSQQSNAPTTDTKAADLRTVLNNLQTEHVSLASAATRAGYDGSPMFEASAGSLDQNSVAIADAVGSVYGKEAGDKFLEIWRSHIGFFVDYTVAAKAGDQAGMDKAVQNLNGYVEAISTLLSGANPNLPKEAVASAITEHVTLLKGAVDAHAQGDSKLSYQKQHEADVQIGTIADTLSGAIVKQKPETFN